MTDDAQHGACTLENLRIESYSLETQDEEGLVGDQASQTAFREALHDFQEGMERSGESAWGERDLDELSNEDLDRILQADDGDEAHTVALAVADFAERLAYVIERFRKQPAWRGVERVGIGGGFKESAVGRLAIRQAARRLEGANAAPPLRLLHHGADDAGLVGGLQLVPASLLGDARAILAVDIGGTNVRCGIVETDAHVSFRDKWRHAESEPQQEDLIEGIVQMLRRMIDRAASRGTPLAPFIGLACPGIIRADGSIERGAQNLPGDWESASFHLPRRLCENIPSIQGRKTVVRMHNDAVVQGLSESAYMKDVKRWAVLTIGTGLGNASFENLPRRAV